MFISWWDFRLFLLCGYSEQCMNMNEHSCIKICVNICCHFSWVCIQEKNFCVIWNLYLTLWWNVKPFSRATAQFCILVGNVWGVSFPHIIVNTHYCLSLIITNPMSVKQYLIVVFICISLVINVINHIFMSLIAICNIHWRNIYSTVSTLSNWIIAFLLLNFDSYFAFWILDLYQVYDLQVFSPIL